MTVTQIAIGLCATIKVCELIVATSELVTNAMKEVLPDGITAGGAVVSFLAALGCLWAAVMTIAAGRRQAVAHQDDATMSPVGCPPPTFT